MIYNSSKNKKFKNLILIQEAHITSGHALMEYIEDKLLECGHINLQKKP